MDNFRVKNMKKKYATLKYLVSQAFNVGICIKVGSVVLLLYTSEQPAINRSATSTSVVHKYLMFFANSWGFFNDTTLLGVKFMKMMDFGAVFIICAT